MAWWNKLGQKLLNFFTFERTKAPPKKRKSSVRKTTTTTHVSRETSEETQRRYHEALAKLRDTQSEKKRLERIMFDEESTLDVRRAALDDYTNLTGWYRPDDNSEWTNEEWRKWEEIYEAEPEIW